MNTYMFTKGRNSALLYFRTLPPFPRNPYILLMILVQNVMLIKESYKKLGSENQQKRSYSPPKFLKTLKSHHEETRLERHYSLATLTNRRRKIFEIPMTFAFTHYLCNADLVLIWFFIFPAPKTS